MIVEFDGIPQHFGNIHILYIPPAKKSIGSDVTKLG